MPFVIVEPGSFQHSEPLQEGECSISRNATLTARADDLGIVGITNYAIVMADTDTLRLGLRAVRDGEEQKSVACSIISAGQDKHDSGRRRILVNRALQRLGLTAEAVAGRYTLMSKEKDGLLFVVLSEAKDVPTPGVEQKS